MALRNPKVDCPVTRSSRDGPALPLLRRLASAVRRRGRYVGRLLGCGSQSPEERALAWLLATATEAGLPADFVETALDYGCRAEALRWTALQETTPTQPVRPTLSRTARLARLAVHCYRTGRTGRAERFLRAVERRQGRDGSFRSETTGQPDPWAAKYYLDAALWRVRASFDAHWQELPNTIDPEDGRMVVVAEWFATMPRDARVVDLGCGRGRFLRPLVEQYPTARLVGLDPAPAMLAQLPPEVTAHAGSLLRTGLADAEFDGALAVESLEHALVPQRALAEMCRIVRPGGSILVIDKDRRRQPLSLYEPWERWVSGEELLGWLEPYCYDLAVRHVAHREGRPGRDLFLAVTGRRR